MENFEKPNIPENSQQSSEKEQISYAPEVWKTVKNASKEIDLSTYLINSIIEQYRDSNPEYFKEFKSKTGFPREHLSPEIIKILREKSEEIEEVPEGWKTNKKIGTELGRNRKLITKIVDRYRESNPEYFKDFKPKSGSSVSEHYSPELVQIINENLPSVPKDGSWKNASQLENTLGVNQYQIQKLVNNYRETNPEYFKNFTVKGGTSEHYSSELIELIKEELDTIPGWKNAKELEELLNISHSLLKKKISKYKSSHFEYFNNFRDKDGKISEHYSPELISILEPIN